MQNNRIISIYTIHLQKKISMKYKNIIFDLGGVILNIDFQLTIDAFKNLGVKDFDAIFSATVQSDLFDKLDIGQISPEKFRHDLTALSGKDISSEDFNCAWNTMILDFPVERIKYIKALRKKYSLFLLSNTNAIHFPVYNSQLTENFRINSISDLFDKAYFSYQIGLRKPDLRIFRMVIDENSLNTNETLFVDDNEQNIIAARKAGIDGYFIQPPFTIEKDLDTVLLNGCK